jgi:hypothetical protein
MAHWMAQIDSALEGGVSRISIYGSAANCCRQGRSPKQRGQMKPVCRRDLDTLGALGVLAMAAGSADDEHGAALAAARLVGRHRGVGGGGVVVVIVVVVVGGGWWL